MKLFFFLFLILLLWSNNNALRCVNDGDQRGFKGSDLFGVKENIDNLDTAEGYNVCSVAYGVHYPQKIFVVGFNLDSMSSPGNVNMDVMYQMRLTMASNGSIVDPASGGKLLLFKCDDEDACERQFWRDHIDWFIREESTILETAFRSILMTEIKEKGKIDIFTINRKVS